MRRAYVLIGLLSGACGTTALPTPPTPAAVEYTLFGFVQDTAFRPLGDVRIEVVDGGRAGVAATTDSLGRYELPGVFTGSVTIKAAKTAYIPASKTYKTEYAGRQSLAFTLELDGPSANVTGDYTLTLTADAACTGLSSVARTRTYAAAIAPQPLAISPNAFQVTLSGASFLPSIFGDRMVMGVAGNVARFDTDFDGIGLAEELPDATYLAFAGQANLVIEGTHISGPFDGVLEYCPSLASDRRFYSCQVQTVSCRSSNHRVLLVRR
jgi:hypothetical protein